jgi:hypothetical protein
MSAAPFLLATAQLPISGDARLNAGHVRATMREAAAQGARLVHFPEGMLSGYAKNPIQDWTEVDWDSVREELRWSWPWPPNCGSGWCSAARTRSRRRTGRTPPGPRPQQAAGWSPSVGRGFGDVPRASAHAPLRLIGT